MPSATNKPFEATRGPQGRFQRRVDKNMSFRFSPLLGLSRAFQATASNFCLSLSQRLWRGLHIGQGSRTEARAKQSRCWASRGLDTPKRPGGVFRDKVMCCGSAGLVWGTQTPNGGSNSKNGSEILWAKKIKQHTYTSIESRSEIIYPLHNNSKHIQRR